MAPSDRTVLFLQGPPSPFWSELADAVAARGARVRRVNLCLADALFWRRGGAVAYRGRLRGWRRWLAAHVRDQGVTDILVYADRLPYHRLAAKVARAQGIALHAVEFGYLRPDWLTLERGGLGAFSHFPDDPARWPEDLPPPDGALRYPHAFAQEATGEVAFNLLAALGRPLFPFYAPDKPIPPILDYLAWLAKLARGPRTRRAAAAAQAACLSGAWPYTLLALQLPTDYQLRACAPFPDQRAMLEEVLADFAAHAPADRRLAVKLHPLDNGWTDWAGLIGRLAAAHGVADRTLTIDGGELGPLVAAAQGVLTINSTVGVHALRAGRPVMALGAAIYAAPGLTWRGPLSAFWTEATPPDPETLARFLAALAAEVQVKGSFYHREGRRVAAAEMAARIVEGRVGPACAAPGPPPRLAALHAARRARGLQGGR